MQLGDVLGIAIFVYKISAKNTECDQDPFDISNSHKGTHHQRNSSTVAENITALPVAKQLRFAVPPFQGMWSDKLYCDRWGRMCSRR